MAAGTFLQYPVDDQLSGFMQDPVLVAVGVVPPVINDQLAGVRQSPETRSQDGGRYVPTCR